MTWSLDLRRKISRAVHSGRTKADQYTVPGQLKNVQGQSPTFEERLVERINERDVAVTV